MGQKLLGFGQLPVGFSPLLYHKFDRKQEEYGKEVALCYSHPSAAIN